MCFSLSFAMPSFVFFVMHLKVNCDYYAALTGRRLRVVYVNFLRNVFSWVSESES